MAWIEEIQRSLGGPVVAFALQHWLLLLIAGVVGVMWLFGSFWDRTESVVSLWFGSDGDSDSGDGGGSDSGGGGD